MAFLGRRRHSGEAKKNGSNGVFCWRQDSLLAFSLASEDRFDIVAVWIEYKCGAVVRPAQARRAVFSPAGLEGGGVECIDLR
ncbi:MAG: hypothetical protein QOF90_1666, partial [Acetobacteraceae bacterium]|nr:hypothetical protein [Acetobacteraceae bacterium]